jgi:hypothetical protein
MKRKREIRANFKFNCKNAEINNEKFEIEFETNVKNLHCKNIDFEYSIYITNVEKSNYKIILSSNYDLDTIRNLLEIAEHKGKNLKLCKNTDLLVTSKVKYKNKNFKMLFEDDRFCIFDSSKCILKIIHRENTPSLINICKNIIESRDFCNNFIYRNLTKILYLLPVIKDCFLNNRKISKYITGFDTFLIQIYVKNSERRKFNRIFKYYVIKKGKFFHKKCLLFLEKNEKQLMINLNYDFDLISKILTAFQNLIIDNFSNFSNISFHCENKLYVVSYNSYKFKICNEFSRFPLIEFSKDYINPNNLRKEIESFMRVLNNYKKIKKSYQVITNNLFNLLANYIDNKLLKKFNLNLK